MAQKIQVRRMRQAPIASSTDCVKHCMHQAPKAQWPDCFRSRATVGELQEFGQAVSFSSSLANAWSSSNDFLRAIL